MKRFLSTIVFSLVLMLGATSAAFADEVLDEDSADEGQEESAEIYESETLVEDALLSFGISCPQEYADGISIPVEIVAPAEDSREYKVVWMKDNWKEWGVIQDFSSNRACTWSPAESGSYVLYLDARDASGRVATTTASFEVSESWSLDSFSAGVASPSLSGVDVPLVAATSGNNAALTYKFVWMKDNWKEWGVIQYFSASSECVWEPVASGSYTLYVDVKNSAGSIRSYQTTHVVKDVSLEVTDGSSQDFSTGMAIGLQAVSSSNASFVSYKFVWMKDNWKEWGVIQNFSASSACTWEPVESGSYTLYVDAKDARGKVASATCSVELAEDWSLESFSSSLEGPIVMGSNASIDLEVITSGNNAALSYKFVWMKDNWKEWGVIRGFGADATCSWSIPASGDYTLYVDVKNSAGKTESHTMNLSVVKPWGWDGDGVTISEECQKPGETVEIFTAVSGDIDDLMFKFVWMKDDWKEWGVIRGWSDSSSCEWTPLSAGDYTIYIDALDGNGEVETKTIGYKAWEYRRVKAAVHYTGQGATKCSVTVTPDMGCTNPVGLQYKYVWMKDGWSEWGVIQDWSDLSSVEWIPEEKGTYSFYVDVKDPEGNITSKSTTQLVMADPYAGAFQGISSQTNHLIIVDCSKNKVTIYTGAKNEWTAIKHWDCATGAWGTPTVKGYYTIGYRGYYFDSENVRLFYWTQFYGDYLFHSTTFYQYPTPSHPVDDRVGLGISHGCVRLHLENAKWIYDNIPKGTQVYIF